MQLQSALNPAGMEAAAIHRHLIFLLTIAAIVCVLVIGALLAIVRTRRSGLPDAIPGAAREATATRAVRWSLGTTFIVLFVVLGYDFMLARRLSAGTHHMADDHANDAALTIDVVGHQWWWSVEYPDSAPQNRVRLANEIHIPVGRPVRIRLASRDVIHSFWVPSLAGKKDLIPGHENEIWLRAEKAGIYRGQCAEFCGLQHAKMALVIVAQPPDSLAAWLALQRTPASPPPDALTRRGLAIVERGPCAVCHNITGTLANAGVGPDLTHLASRLTLAAGTLPNSEAMLASWISDPQALKPGTQMPPHALSRDDLRAVVAYLRTLQ